MYGIVDPKHNIGLVNIMSLGGCCNPLRKGMKICLFIWIAPDTMKNKTIFQTTTFSTFGSALLWTAKAAQYGSPGEIVILTGKGSRSMSLDCLLYGWSVPCIIHQSAQVLLLATELPGIQCAWLSSGCTDAHSHLAPNTQRGEALPSGPWRTTALSS